MEKITERDQKSLMIKKSTHKKFAQFKVDNGGTLEEIADRAINLLIDVYRDCMKDDDELEEI